MYIIIIIMNIHRVEIRDRKKKCNERVTAPRRNRDVRRRRRRRSDVAVRSRSYSPTGW